MLSSLFAVTEKKIFDFFQRKIDVENLQRKREITFFKDITRYQRQEKKQTSTKTCITLSTIQQPLLLILHLSP